MQFSKIFLVSVQIEIIKYLVLPTIAKKKEISLGVPDDADQHIFFSMQTQYA